MSDLLGLHTVKLGLGKLDLVLERNVLEIDFDACVKAPRASHIRHIFSIAGVIMRRYPQISLVSISDCSEDIRSVELHESPSIKGGIPSLETICSVICRAGISQSRVLRRRR